MKISPNLFILLSILGFGLLWGFTISNGTLDAVNEVQMNGVFPGGRSLRSVYTGYKLVDWALTKPVCFFDAFINGSAPGPRLLSIDLVAVIHCANLWSVIDSRRRGLQTEWMRHPTLWIVAWNSFGAAVVLPLYCYCICLNDATKRDHTIPSNEARAFIPTTIVGSFFPLIFFAPAMLKWGTYHEHGYVAHYLWATVLGYIIVLTIASRPGATSKKDPKNPDVDSIYVSMSYILAGIYAATVHAYTLWVSIMSSDLDLSLSRLFVPSPGRVTLSPSVKLVEGAHLFAQFDWYVVVLTCMVFAYLQIEQGTKLQAPLTSMLKIRASWEKLLGWGSIGLSTVLFGPGAAASFSLAVREHGLRTAPKYEKTL